MVWGGAAKHPWRAHLPHLPWAVYSRGTHEAFVLYSWLPPGQKTQPLSWSMSQLMLIVKDCFQLPSFFCGRAKIFACPALSPHVARRSVWIAGLSASQLVHCGAPLLETESQKMYRRSSLSSTKNTVTMWAILFYFMRVCVSRQEIPNPTPAQRRFTAQHAGTDMRHITYLWRKSPQWPSSGALFVIGRWFCHWVVERKGWDFKIGMVCYWYWYCSVV